MNSSVSLSSNPAHIPETQSHVPSHSPSRKKSILSVIALLTTMGLLVLGYGLQGTLIGLRARYDNIPLDSIGFMMSAFFIGFGAGSLLAPRFVFTVGHIRTFAALASISSAAALGYLLVGGSINWFILRMIQGICYGGMIVVVESWLNGSTPDTHRGRILSIYQIIISSCWAGSQFLLTLAPVTGFILFCVVSILISLSLVPITLSKVESPLIPEPAPARFSSLAVISPIGVVGAFVSGMSLNAFMTMGAPFLDMHGVETSWIPMFMALPLIGGMLFQWPAGWCSDFIDRRLVTLYCTLIAGVAAGGIAYLSSDNQSYLLMAGIIFGAGSMPIYAICAASVADSVLESELVSAIGGLILLYAAGSIVGPLLSGYLMGWFGPDSLFTFISVIHITFFFFVLYWIRKRLPIAPEARDSFTVFPRTTYAAVQMDERTSEGDDSAVDPVLRAD